VYALACTRNPRLPVYEAQLLLSSTAAFVWFANIINQQAGHFCDIYCIAAADSTAYREPIRGRRR
jgi:hypothetical protein